MVAWRAWWKDILMIIQSIDEQYQDKDQNTHKLEQFVTVLGDWLFLPRGSWSAASCHKVFDDAFGSLHTACSEQQEIHLVVWQLEHFSTPRFFDCPQFYTRHETLRKTDWQLPIKFQKWDWSDVTNYSTQASSNKRRFTLVYLKHHCMESASFFTLSTDSIGSSKSSFPNSSYVDCGKDWKGTNLTAGVFDPSAPPLPVPSAFEVLLVAAEGVSLGAFGFGSFDVPGMFAFGELAVEFSINPFTGDSGVDRVVAAGSLSIQLRKSWIWSFSCTGRYWNLAKWVSK